MTRRRSPRAPAVTAIIDALVSGIALAAAEHERHLLRRIRRALPSRPRGGIDSIAGMRAVVTATARTYVRSADRAVRHGAAVELEARGIVLAGPPRTWGPTEMGRKLATTVSRERANARLAARYEAVRPRLRSDCLEGGSNAARPCPWVSCRHHLAIDRRPGGDGVRVLRGWETDEATRYSCALDVTDEHPEGISQAQVGDLLGLSKNRIQCIEYGATEAMMQRLLSSGASEADIRAYLAGLPGDEDRGPMPGGE